MYVISLLILHVSTLAFKLIWFSFWEIWSCKMLWYINTISVRQTDTVSYVKMMYFTSILKVIPPFLGPIAVARRWVGLSVCLSTPVTRQPMLGFFSKSVGLFLVSSVADP